MDSGCAMFVKGGIPMKVLVILYLILFLSVITLMGLTQHYN